MRYSVYNYTTRQYDYYDGSGPKGAHAGAPPVAQVRSALGATPEQAAWALPADATPAGSGDMPQGRVAVQKSIIDMVPTWALAAGAGLAAWWVLFRSKKRSA